MNMFSHCVLILFGVCQITCSKVLFLATLPVHSHFTIAFSLAKELADRGHEVTFVNPFPQKTPLKNLKDVPILEPIAHFEEKRKQFSPYRHRYLYQILSNTAQIGYTVGNIVFQSKTFKDLMNKSEETKYDVVIIEYFCNEAYVGLGYHFKAPVVILSSLASNPLINYLVANPDSSSYNPNILTPIVGQMNFWQRFENLWTNLVIRAMRQLNHLPNQRKLFKKFISSDVDFDEVLYNNISLLMVNSHLSFNNPLPQVPAVVEIGGYHINPSKVLPKDLQEFMDNSKEGVVLFSMGSNLKSKDLKPAIRAAILQSFSKIKQNVLWKFEENLPEASSNVRIMSWLPQQEVMAHPNTKAFISHGGLLGSIEAVYYGVPMLGISVYDDQHNNVNRAVAFGFALSISLEDITEETFSALLHQILNNPKYQENVRKRSRLMKDQPIPPKDLAVYWIEHVIRYKGAPHLRTAGLALAWYQRESIDILAFLIVLIMLGMYIFCKIVTTIKPFLCEGRNTKVSFNRKIK